MRSSALFCLLVVVFLVGVLIGAWPLGTPWAWIAAGVLVFLVWLLSSRFLFAVAAGCLFCGGFLRAQMDWKRIEGVRADTGLPQFAVIDGCLVEAPDERSDEQLLVLAPVQNLSQSSASRAARLLVRAPAGFALQYGDCIRAEGLLASPVMPGRDVSYARYLAVAGIGLTLTRARVEIRGHDPPSRVLEALLRFRSGFEQRLIRLIPEPAGSFAAGLLLGTRGGLSEDVQEAFRASGLTHVVALSGSNVALLASFLFGLLAGPFPRRVALWVTLLAIAIFAFLTGLPASLVRASIMGSLLLVARQAGRPSSALSGVNLLFGSAALMALWRPLALMWDPGFQLSFCAMAGVLFVAPLFERVFAWLPEFFSLRESITLSVATQLATLPVALWHFGRVAWIAPFANALVLPLLPPAMLMALAAVLVGTISESAGHLLALIPTLLLETAIVLVQFTAAIASFSFS